MCQSPRSSVNPFLDILYRVHDEATEFYGWLFPHLSISKHKQADQAETWALVLPYFGETPLEIVLFVGSAIGFRIYQSCMYYFWKSQRGGTDTKNGTGARSWRPSWSHGEPACSRGAVGSNGESRKPQNLSRRWQWIFPPVTPHADRPVVPDAKATHWGTYRDPSLTAFMNKAQEVKGKLRHVPDPEFSRRKRLQAIRSKTRVEPKGSLGLTDHLLQTKRSTLRETVWETTTTKNNEHLLCLVKHSCLSDLSSFDEDTTCHFS